MKRIGIMVLLAVAILFGTKEPYFANGTIVASGQCGDSITWTLDNNGHMTLSGTGEIWEGEVIEGRQQSLWNGYADKVITLEIQEGITYIRSFGDMDNLKHVEFPNTLEVIGDYAFSGCSKLENFVLPNSLRGLGQEAFQSCSSITAVTIPDSVTYLSVYVFNYCENLKYLYIGGQEGGYAYSSYQPIGSVPALEKFEVSPNHPAFSTRDGVLYTKDGTCMIEYPDGKKDRIYRVPEGTVEISGGAICDIEVLEEIILPEGLLILGDGAIAGCDGLSSITIPSTLTSAEAGTTGRTGSITNCYNLDYIENNSNILFPLDWNLKYWLDESGNQVQAIGKGRAYQHMDIWEIWMWPHEYKVDKGTTIEFDDYINFVYADNYWGLEDLSFESSDPNVATVSEKGVITTVNYGTAIITVKPKVQTENSAPAETCKIIVSAPINENESVSGPSNQTDSGNGKNDPHKNEDESGNKEPIQSQTEREDKIEVSTETQISVNTEFVTESENVENETEDVEDKNLEDTELKDEEPLNKDDSSGYRVSVGVILIGVLLLVGLVVGIKFYKIKFAKK